MKSLKSLKTNNIWFCLSIVLGIVYMRLIIGPYNSATADFWNVSSNISYKNAFIFGGIKVGLLIAILYFLVYKIYLKRLSIGAQFLGLLVNTLFVGLAHYILEKVINVI